MGELWVSEMRAGRCWSLRRSMSTVVLHPHLKNVRDRAAHGLRYGRFSLSPELALQEIEALCIATGWRVSAAEVLAVREAKTTMLMSKGACESAQHIIDAAGVDTPIERVVVNAPLTALQQRNLEEFWGVKRVVDRVGVILEIFAARAHSAEAKLQVELASLQYMKTRLIKPAGEELELMKLDQQRGGMGAMAGAGESHLEVQRRKIRAQEQALRTKLKSVRKQRVTQKSKHRAQMPLVALVGYTNVGKSALFNRLAKQEKAAVDDVVFKTLDPKLTSCFLPAAHARCLVADTVGFVSDLPHVLVQAFAATLDEVKRADLILHVRDASLPKVVSDAHQVAVHEVLGQIGVHGATVDETYQHRDGYTPLVEVWNKCDLLPMAEHPSPDSGVVISAKQGTGVEALSSKIVHGLSLSGEWKGCHTRPDMQWYRHSSGQHEKKQDLDAVNPEVQAEKHAEKARKKAAGIKQKKAKEHEKRQSKR